MLVISQHEGEILQLGPDVRIFVREVKGRWVKLAIDAPESVVIQRIREPSPEDAEVRHRRNRRGTDAG